MGKRAAARCRAGGRDAVKLSYSSLLMPEHSSSPQEHVPTPSQFAPEYYDETGRLKESLPHRMQAGNSESNFTTGNQVFPVRPDVNLVSLKLPHHDAAQLHHNLGALHSGQLKKHHQPRLKFGLSLDASDALRSIGISAERITQTIGHAKPSHGFHDKDGDDVDGHPYTAAVDMSTRIGDREMSDKEIAQLLEKLGQAGFAAWYRNPGHDGWRIGKGNHKHIHAVYAGVKMKNTLEEQVQDYIRERGGLFGHQKYHFHQFSPSAEAVVRERFLHRPKK